MQRSYKPIHISGDQENHPATITPLYPATQPRRRHSRLYRLLAPYYIGRSFLRRCLVSFALFILILIALQLLVTVASR